MQTIVLTTNFDITNTDIVRNYKPTLVSTHPTINSEAGWTKARNQQTNFETVLQVISLRAQPTVLYKPRIQIINKKKQWEFTFTVEFDGVYYGNEEELGLLKNDFRNVPMIINLDESINDEYIEIGKNIRFETDALR